jgi:hypothetical protein
MAFSLYAATIPSYQQILGAVSGLLGTAEAFCVEKGIAPEDILAPGRGHAALAYQVKRPRYTRSVMEGCVGRLLRIRPAS